MRAIVLLCLACAAKPAPERKPPQAEDPVVLFRRAWARDVLPQLEGPQLALAEQWTPRVAGALTVTPVKCADWARQIDDTLGSGLRNNILHGSTAVLATGGDCWLVEGAQKFQSVMGFLEVETGRLLLAWITIEG